MIAKVYVMDHSVMQMFKTLEYNSKSHWQASLLHWSSFLYILYKTIPIKLVRILYRRINYILLLITFTCFHKKNRPKNMRPCHHTLTKLRVSFFNSSLSFFTGG